MRGELTAESPSGGRFHQYDTLYVYHLPSAVAEAPDGESLFGVAGVDQDPVAAPDRFGGALVAFELKARTGENAGGCEIGAERLSAPGETLWKNGERSTLVAYSRWSEKNPVIVCP